MCGSRVDIQSTAAEIRRRKKEEEEERRRKIEITRQLYYIGDHNKVAVFTRLAVSCSIRHNKCCFHYASVVHVLTRQITAADDGLNDRGMLCGRETLMLSRGERRRGGRGGQA